MGAEYAGLLQQGTQNVGFYAIINITQPGEATYQVLLILVHN